MGEVKGEEVEVRSTRGMVQLVIGSEFECCHGRILWMRVSECATGS